MTIIIPAYILFKLNNKISLRKKDEMMSYLYSIVVPVYKAEKYLNKCIDAY